VSIARCARCAAALDRKNVLWIWVTVCQTHRTIPLAWGRLDLACDTGPAIESETGPPPAGLVIPADAQRPSNPTVKVLKGVAK